MATDPGQSAAATAPVIPAEPGTPTPDGPDREFTVRARSQRQQIVRHFLHNKVAMTALVVFVLLLLFAFVGPLINPKDYVDHRQQRPVGAAGHRRATRSAPTRSATTCSPGIMRGIQRSLLIVRALRRRSRCRSAWPIGAIAGYFGRYVDNVLMRIVDLILTVPLLVDPRRRGQQLPERPHAAGRRHHPRRVRLDGPVPDRAQPVPLPAREGVRRGRAGARAPATGGSSSGT